LVKEGGSEEKRSLLHNGDTKPEEAKELLDKMLHISKLIQDVKIFDFHL
jgi:hypothetical protein